MILHPPFEITPRLLPGVRVGGDSFISITYDKNQVGPQKIGKFTVQGNVRFRVFIDTPRFDWTTNELHSGVFGGTLQSAMIDMIGFLRHAADYRDDPEELKGLGMTKKLAEWADRKQYALENLEFEIEESDKNLIEE